MKRFISIFLAIVIVFAFTGCNNNTTHLADKYFEMADSEQLSAEMVISANVAGITMEIPISVYFKDGKMRWHMEYVGNKVDMLLTDSYYMIDDDSKTAYQISLDDEDYKEFIEAFKKAKDRDIKTKDVFEFKSSSAVNKDGQNMTCEVYMLSDKAQKIITEDLENNMAALDAEEAEEFKKTIDGVIEIVSDTEFKYYFLGEELKSIEADITLDSAAFGMAGIKVDVNYVVKINKITTEVDEAMFLLPEGYDVVPIEDIYKCNCCKNCTDDYGCECGCETCIYDYSCDCCDKCTNAGGCTCGCKFCWYDEELMIG